MWFNWAYVEDCMFYKKLANWESMFSYTMQFLACSCYIGIGYAHIEKAERNLNSLKIVFL